MTRECLLEVHEFRFVPHVLLAHKYNLTQSDKLEHHLPQVHRTDLKMYVLHIGGRLNVAPRALSLCPANDTVSKQP